MKATWKGALLAESDDTVVVDGNHYFPADSLDRQHFEDSATRSTCGWKGVAQYYDVIVAGERNKDAAWFYPDTLPKAKHIEGRIAFWKGVRVE